MDTHNRHFRYQWYSQFDWLEYSPSANKAFCFACRVFGRTGQQHEAFVSTGFHNWKTALEKFRVHQCTSAHKTAVLTWRTAERTRNNPETNVVTLVNHQTKNEVDENRRYLKDIIETLIFLGRQGISLRGHRENSESLNKGNFLELLAFRAKDNELIHQFLIKKEKGITYTSHDIQQQLLEIIGKNMIDVIVDEIKSAGIFALILDESLDISRHEQAAVVLRYVNPQFIVKERFVGFFRVVQTDGESLYRLVQQVLSTLRTSTH